MHPGPKTKEPTTAAAATKTGEKTIVGRHYH